MEEFVYSFPPIVANEPRALILGTMPGVVSLNAQEYYAHPRNAFWRIMSELKGVECPVVYEEKQQLIRAMNLALWDVCHTCVRPGSLDSNIRYEEPNALAALLEEHSSIRTIIFNGQPAEKLFRKHLKALRDFHTLTLPSTSPTNTLRYELKLAQWQQIKPLIIP